MIYFIPEPDINDLATVIVRWSIKEVIYGANEFPTRHLVGYVPQESAGRASSAIQELNKENRIILTNSGRVYQLTDKPGKDDDADYVWNNWKRVNGAQVEKDVTDEYWDGQ
jgi:hypothetical protein